MTPALLMVLVQSAFRLGRDFLSMREERVRAADQYVSQIPVAQGNIENAALQAIALQPQLAVNFPRVFNVEVMGCPLFDASKIDLEEKARAIAFGVDLLRPRDAAIPDWAGGSVASVMAVRDLLTPQARRMQWARFGLTLAQTGIQALAAQPRLLGLEPKVETLVGAFASKVSEIIGPENSIYPGDVNGVSFKERAAAVLLQASLSTISENPSMVVSAPHWAQFVGAVLSPLAAAQSEEQGRRLISISQLPRLMRGPMAQAALRTLHERQGDFFGERFAADKAAGAITQEILAAAVRTPAEDFNILNAFSQRGLTLVYTASLNAAATRPELFITERGQSADSLRSLLGNVATILRNAPPPFDDRSGLADQLTCAVIDVAANHLSQRVAADFGDEDAWDTVTGRILGSIVEGFRSGLTARVADAGAANPFLSVFNKDQAVEIVRIIAAQAAQTPEMLLGPGRRNEVYAISQAVAAFMSDPNTRLASAADWRAVIAVALDEAAKNPGTLFALDLNARPESQLAVSLISALLSNAAASVRDVPGVGATVRRPGSVLFGNTLRQAIEMTLRAAANNASMLLDQPTHLAALNAFIEKVQSYVQDQNGRLGSAEWLWLYRSFIAEVIATGSAEGITEQRLAAMVASAPGLPAPADEPGERDTREETPLSGEDSES